MDKLNLSDPGPDPEEDYPELKGVKKTWDKKTRQLRKVHGLLTARSDDAPEHVAGRFLARYSRLLGKDSGNVLEDLKLEQVTSSPAGHEVRFRQYVGEVPVYRGRVIVYITRRGQVYGFSNNYYRIATRAALTGLSKGSLEGAKARQIAVAEVGGEGRLRAEPEAELVVYPQEAGNLLSWCVRVTLERPVEAWVVIVDANTGRVLDRVPALGAQAK